jgi:hypothetical protein
MYINFTPLNTPGEQGKNPKKYGANAPQLHHISRAPARGAVPDQGSKRKIQKNYGANAPQLHPIRCYIDFHVMLCNEQGKNPKKLRCKRATVVPYLSL